MIGLYGFIKQKVLPQALGYGLAIATKLVPLIFLPALLFAQWPKRGIFVTILAFLIAALTFLPLINEALVGGMGDSLNLYFQSFEFNASIYFLARWIGYFFYGYNQIQFIGPLLAVISLLSISSWSLWASSRKKEMALIMLFSLSFYLLLTTTRSPLVYSFPYTFGSSLWVLLPRFLEFDCISYLYGIFKRRV